MIERFDPSVSLYTYSVGAAKTLGGIYDVYMQGEGAEVRRP